MLFGMGVGLSCGKHDNQDDTKFTTPLLRKNRPVKLDPDAVFDGIDISAHQGIINWDSLDEYNPNLVVIYVRAIGKRDIDTLYHDNVVNARQHGFMVGSYHFFNMANSVDEQFDCFKEMVKKEYQDLRPMLDIEKQSLSPDDNSHLRDSVLKMARLMEQHYGSKPVIYSNQNFYNKYLANTFYRYPLWIANYSRKPVITKGKAILWQRSCTTTIPGINTAVDTDKFVNGGNLKTLLFPVIPIVSSHVGTKSTKSTKSKKSTKKR